MQWSLLTEICAFCHKAISPRAPTLEAMNKQYHADCFTCRTCQHALAGQHYYQKDGRPLCVACYQVGLPSLVRPLASWLKIRVLVSGCPLSEDPFTPIYSARNVKGYEAVCALVQQKASELRGLELSHHKPHLTPSVVFLLHASLRRTPWTSVPCARP